MPKTRVRVPYLDLSGGLNEDDAPGALQPTEWRTGQNMYLEGNAPANRKGSDRLQSTAINSGAAVNGIFQLVRTQGTVFDTVAVVGNKIYKDAETASPADITGAVTITAGAGNHVTAIHVNDLALFCNGVDAPWKWSGSGNAAALGGSPPIFRTMISKFNRTFGAGHTAAPRTIRYSAMGDPETWTSTFTVPAVLGDASAAAEGRDFLWQLGHLGDSIFVGLENSIGRVLYTGDATTPFRYTQLAEFGSAGPKNYVAVGNGGYFLSQRGVHFIRPSDILITYESSLISGRRLRKTWASLNKNRIRDTSGELFSTSSGNLIVVWPLTTSGGSAHNIMLVMDVTEGPGREKFFVWTGMPANCLAAVVHATTRAPQLLFGTTAGFIWQADTGSDDEGAGYFSELTTRWEDFGVPSEKKNFRDLYVEVSQGGAFNLNAEVYMDYNTTATQSLGVNLMGSTQDTWGGTTWGGGHWATRGIVRQYLLGVDDGVVMSFRFYTSGAGQRWALYKVVPAVEAVGEAVEA
jgi:hypothetical protein